LVERYYYNNLTLTVLKVFFDCFKKLLESLVDLITGYRVGFIGIYQFSGVQSPAEEIQTV